MINILVDEGYAYDYLAILQVKKSKINSDISHANFEICQDKIASQIIFELHDEIINSKEYKSLVEINNKVFDAVNKARYGIISAKEVDDLNMKRYYAKTSLQQRFFPLIELSEEKLQNTTGK